VISVDEDQFIKLFTKDLAIWFDLNKSGMRVFAALLTVIQKEAIRRDLVYLDRTDEAIEEFKIQKTTFFNGIEELLAKGFIARHVSSGWYFINPTMFFNGDRARFVKEYRKEKIPNRAIQIDLFDKQKSIL
jgi:predicted DNA-binding transcriptional regulator